MTPKEKAAELVDKFMKYEPIKLSDCTRIEYPSAINLAKMGVDEFIADFQNINEFDTDQLSFWEEVKQELNEL